MLTPLEPHSNWLSHKNVESLLDYFLNISKQLPTTTSTLPNISQKLVNKDQKSRISTREPTQTALTHAIGDSS
jgi:hypothetical protein